MKKSTKLFLILGAAVVVLGIAAGFAFGWGYSPSDYSYHEFELEEAPTDTGDFTAVTVSTSSLHVNIYASSDKCITLSSSGTFADERVDISYDGGTLLITEKPLSALHKLVAAEDAYLYIRIPYKWAGSLTVSSESGAVYLNDLEIPSSPIDISVDSGYISANRVTASEAKFTSSSGGISVSDFYAGTLTAESDSGYIMLGKLHTDSASLTAESGMISVENSTLTDTLALSTRSGYMRLDTVDAPSFTAESTSGDLDFESLDTNAFSFTSSSGDLTGRLLYADEFAVSVSTVSGEISGISDTPDGERTFVAETVSGNITIR